MYWFLFYGAVSASLWLFWFRLLPWGLSFLWATWIYKFERIQITILQPQTKNMCCVSQYLVWIIDWIIFSHNKFSHLRFEIDDRDVEWYREIYMNINRNQIRWMYVMVESIISSENFRKYTKISCLQNNYSLMSTKCQGVKLKVSHFKTLKI